MCTISLQSAWAEEVMQYLLKRGVEREWECDKLSFLGRFIHRVGIWGRSSYYHVQGDPWCCIWSLMSMWATCSVSVTPRKTSSVPGTWLVFNEYLLSEQHVGCCSVTLLCQTPYDPIDCSMPGFTISWSLLKLMSFESVMPSISSSVAPFSSCPQPFPASR